MPSTYLLKDKFPNLEIRTFTERLGAQFAGKPVKGEDLNLLKTINDAGKEIYFIIPDLRAQAAAMELRTQKEKVDMQSDVVLDIQKAASQWAQIDGGVLTFTPPPSENKDYIVCELNYDKKSDSFFVKKPDERAIINGKGLTGRAVFAYTNEEGELVYIFANNSKFGGSLTSWGGKADLSDLAGTAGLNGKVLENKAIANAAIRETIEEIDVTKIFGLMKQAVPVNLERVQAAIEANGNTLNTATVVLYLGKAPTSAFEGILATAHGQSEEIEGLVHVKASCIEGIKGKLSLETLFGISIEQIEALKGELIPAKILSVMSHEAFKSGIMTQEAINAITAVAGRRVDNTALTSLQDADNMATILEAMTKHTSIEEKADDEKKDDSAADDESDGNNLVINNDVQGEDDLELMGIGTLPDLD